MKKRYLVLFMAVLMITALLAACGGNDSEDQTDNNTEEGTETNGETSGLEGSITMAGSTSVQPLSEELASAFMEKHPDTRLEVSGGGSGAGVTAAQSNAADFGAVSREIKEDETGINEHVIAIDGIAIIAHPDNPVSDIPLEDISKIFSGEIANWSEVGGDDNEVVVVSREDGSGTRGAFTDIVLGDKELVASALIQNTTGGVAEAVSNDVNAIGYVSVGAMSDNVKGLAVDGVEPTGENIKAGDYKVSRPFNYVTNADTELSELAQAFLDFVLSEEGQQVVEENGFVSVN